MAPFLSHQGDCHSADRGQACSAQPPWQEELRPQLVRQRVPTQGLSWPGSPAWGDVSAGQNDFLT